MTECAGSCLNDLNNCNVLFYDEVTRSCWLGTLGANLTVLVTPTQSISGYVEISKRFSFDAQKHINFHNLHV